MTDFHDLFSMDSDGLRKFLCPHGNLTPEDGTGRAICVDCNARVNVRLTPEILEDFARRMLDR